MALVTNNLTVTKAEFLAGVPMTALQGDGGGTCPIVVHLFATASGLPEDPFTEMELYTSSPIDTATGVTSSGIIGVDKSLTNSGDDIIYTGSGGAIRNYASGFWAGVIQGNLVGTGIDDSTLIELSIQCLVSLPPDFTGPAEPPTTPTDGEIEEADFEDDTQEVTLTWTTDGTEDGTIISIDDGVTEVVIGATPPNIEEVTFLLPPGLVGPVNIIIQTYVGPPGNISPQLIVPIVIPANITPPIEGGLTIDMALAGTMQVIGDPSGIYVLVPGKTHDTLYERAAGVTTTQEVAIPRPFGKVTYVPESD